MLPLHFLSADQPLTKKYSLAADGTIVKDSYLNAYEVTSHDVEIASIDDFLDALTFHAGRGHCLLKGKLSRPLVKESRAGSTDANDSTEWICLDIDGLPSTHSVDELLTLLGLSTASYVLQWSASHGITEADKLRCHIFMLLDKPYPAAVIKQWLIQLNLTVPFLLENQSLSKSGMALRWCLDVTACQNDKLIYITKPILEGIKNPLGRQPRYSVHHREHPVLRLPAQINPIETNRHLTQAIISKLRAEAGLPSRKYVTREYKTVEVLAKPDQAMVTGIKHDRGFVYLNLNGGDSWGYYHPIDSCDILYNFKGEPNYAIKELLPDYYAQAAQQARQQQKTTEQGVYKADNEHAPVLLAFRDEKTGTYYHGRYWEATETLDLSVAKTEKQVRDFCMQHGMPIGEYVPIWDVRFDPQDNVRVDIANRYVNTFERTQFMRNVSATPPRACPPTILKVIHHMLGNEVQLTEHFINWLGFIVQHRTRAETAWLIYGTEGTGKGLFYKRVLRPLFGTAATQNRVDEFDGQFNAFINEKLVIFLDEVDVPRLKNPDLVMGKIRNIITEETVSIREMRTTAVPKPNYSSLIMGSNQPNAIILSDNDRRYNIGRFQHKKLMLSEAENETMDDGSELQAFYDYLYHLAVDVKAAKKPLATQDRDNLIATTSNSADDIAAALHPDHASMEFFLDQLPTDDGYQTNALMNNRVEDYKLVLFTLLQRTLAAGGKCNVARDELRTLFDYTVGNIPDTPHKFTKYLRHRHITTKRVRIENKSPHGIQVNWADFDRFDTYLAEHFPIVKAATKAAAKTSKT
jgi:hypothetical protein